MKNIMDTYNTSYSLEQLAPPCRNCARSCKELNTSHILWCGNQVFKQVTAYKATPCKTVYENAVKELKDKPDVVSDTKDL